MSHQVCIYPYCETTPDTTTGMCQAHQVAVGAMYRHFKGGIYHVMAVARHSESDDEHLVIYRSVSDGRVWARPLESFVSLNESGVRRFGLITR